MDNLKPYQVTFEPLVKAPKALNLCALTFKVNADEPQRAEHFALSELIQAGLSRKHFKRKAIIKVIENDNNNEVNTNESKSEDPTISNETPVEEAPSLEEVKPESKPANTLEAPITEQSKKAAAALGLEKEEGQALEVPPTPAELIAAEILDLNVKVLNLAPGEVLRLEDVSNDAYHGSIGVSCSNIKVMVDECPAAYHAVVTGIRERKESNIFNIGSAIHGVILEPHNFERDFGVMPADLKKPTSAQMKAAKPSEATLAQIVKWNEWTAIHGHKTMLTQDQYEGVKMARDSVLSHNFGKRLVANGKPEVSFWRRDEATGLIIKARADYVLGDLIIDVKSCENSEPAAFAKHSVNYGYHIQDSFYRHVTGIKEFAFLAVEKKAPCVVTAPLLFDAEARRLGELQFRAALLKIAECTDSGIWPGHATGVSTMSLPTWEARKISDLEIDNDFNQTQGAA